MIYAKFFIPAPTGWISLNDRSHWAVVSKRVKLWRTVAKYTAQAHELPKGLERVHVTAYVHKSTNHQYDAHNLTSTGKAIVDGLVDYGLVPDDTNKYVIGPDMRMGEKLEAPGITIEIEEVT